MPRRRPDDRQTTLRQERSRPIGKQLRSLHPFHRRLRFESLEPRRLLAFVVPAYSSLPSAPYQLYLDFNGSPALDWASGAGVVRAHGPGGNDAPIPAFTIDGNFGDYNADELDAIRDIWSYVAEKYSPFNINVTTIDPGVINNGVSVQVLIGGSDADWNQAGNGGIAAIGGFNDLGLSNTCFVWSADSIDTGSTTLNADDRHFIGETVAHEAGHEFGLVHQRRGDGMGGTNDEYYDGDAMRAPIMGDSSTQPTKRGIWWRTNMEGGQNSPNPVQDEIAQLRSVLGTPTFDVGGTNFSDSWLLGDGALEGVPLSNYTDNGVITDITDNDYFRFTATGLNGGFTVSATTNGGMLAPWIGLYNDSGLLLTFSSAGTGTSANISWASLTPGGTYYVLVNSAGNYGDIGQYTITGGQSGLAFYNDFDRTLYVLGREGNANLTISQSGSAIIITDTGATQTFNDAYFYVDRIAVYTGSGDDTITVQPIADVFPMTIHGGDGTDSVILNSSLANHDITVASTFVYGLNGTATWDYSAIELLTINGNVLADGFYVQSIAPGTPVVLNGGDGSDWCSIGDNDDFGLTVIGDDVTFDGGGGSDSYALNDQLNPYGPVTYTVFGTAVSTSLDSTIIYSGANSETFTLYGSAAGGIFNVELTNAGVNTTMFGQIADDAFNITPFFQDLSFVTGPLTLRGVGGNDTLTLNDQNGASDFSVGADNVSFNGTPGIVYHDQVENIVVNGGNGNNYFNIDGPNLMAAVEINAGEGNDTIAIASNSLNLSNIGADVSVDGQGGSDTLFVHNQNGLARNETLSATSVGDGNHTYSYAGIESLSIDLSQFDETMYIIASSPSTYTTIYANGGQDTCYFLTSDLSNTYGVTFYGQDGSDTATLNDQNATGSHTYEVGASAITRGTFAFSYGGLEALELAASNVADTINLNSAASGTSITVNAGGGDDVITIPSGNTLDRSMLLNLGEGDDLVNIDTISLTNVFDAITIAGGSGSNDRVNQIFNPVSGYFQPDRVEVRDTFVRHIARFSPIGGGVTYVGTVNYSGIERYDLSRTSGFAIRYSVTSTPAGTDFFLTGSVANDVFLIGRGETVLQANPHMLDFIRSRVDVVGGGGTDTLELDDTADTTGDSVRVQPNRISNGPAAPLFDVGGWVNYYSISSTTINLGYGADTIYAQPSNQDAITINANDPSAAPGDTLNLALANAQNYVINSTGVGAGNVTSDNLQILSWTGVEDGPVVDAIAPQIIAQSYDDTVVPTILVQFSEDVSLALSVSYLKLTNTATGPVSIGLIAMTYDSGTNTASFTFPGYPGGRLPAGNYTARILPGLPDQFGNALLGPTPTLLFSIGPPLPGDYNLNGVVDAADYVVWRKTLGTSGVTAYSGADGDGDTTIDQDDYDVWRAHFGQTVAAGSAASAHVAESLRDSVASISERQPYVEAGTTVSERLPYVIGGAARPELPAMGVGVASTSRENHALRPRLRDVPPARHDDALLAWLERRASRADVRGYGDLDSFASDETSDDSHESFGDLVDAIIERFVVEL